jgi:glycerophosphoryl diester phosphodiesterase
MMTGEMPGEDADSRPGGRLVIGRGAPDRSARPLLIAHRGAARQAPEHTIPAYEAALDAGADVLALDVQLTLDDQLVVIKDAQLERTTDGRGPVRAHTVRQLKRLDAGGWFGRRFRGQRLQMLGEVIERFRERAALGITLPGGSDLYPGIEERLVGLLQIYDVVEHALVASFDHHALRRCRALDPDVRTSALLVGRLLAPAALAPPGVLDAVGLSAEWTGPGDVAALHAAGLACHVFVVDDPAAAERFVAWGVAGLVTDAPDRIRPVLDRAAAGDPAPRPPAPA